MTYDKLVLSHFSSNFSNFLLYLNRQRDKDIDILRESLAIFLVKSLIKSGRPHLGFESNAWVSLSAIPVGLSL